MKVPFSGTFTSQVLNLGLITRRTSTLCYPPIFQPLLVVFLREAKRYIHVYKQTADARNKKVHALAKYPFVNVYVTVI